MGPDEELVEGVDYYVEEGTGLFVLTEEYLRRRGYCCGNGCRHCPYGSPCPPGSGSAPRHGSASPPDAD